MIHAPWYKLNKLKHSCSELFCFYSSKFIALIINPVLMYQGEGAEKSNQLLISEKVITIN